MTEPARYRTTIADSIHLHGWTSHTAQGAVAALSALCASRTGAAYDASAQLANEITRWQGCLRAPRRRGPAG